MSLLLLLYCPSLSFFLSFFWFFFFCTARRALVIIIIIIITIIIIIIVKKKSREIHATWIRLTINTVFYQRSLFCFLFHFCSLADSYRAQSVYAGYFYHVALICFIFQIMNLLSTVTLHFAQFARCFLVANLHADRLLTLHTCFWINENIL